ncbi:MAG: hypothetical protein ACM3NW_07150 [Syntrophomonadaceae bacterium]
MNETFNTPPMTPPTGAPPSPGVPPVAPVPPAALPSYPVIVERKSPALAGFLSIFPGLGHLYLGLYPRAFAVGGAFILGIMMSHRGAAGEFFGPLIAFVWFFGIIDAVRQAKAINRGELAEAGLAGERQLRRAAAGTGGLTWGVILVGLGALLLIDRYFDIDWSFMSEWGGPAAFILLGLVLIVSHVRKRRAENDAQVGMPPRSS